MHKRLDNHTSRDTEGSDAARLWFSLEINPPLVSSAFLLKGRGSILSDILP